MVTVIFRSRLKENLGDGYALLAMKMSELAAKMPGFVSFKTFGAEDGERLSIIEFDSEDSLSAWRDHPEHLLAQKAGRESFYDEFTVQVCVPVRKYGFKSSTN